MTWSRSWGSNSAAGRWMTLAAVASILICAAAAQTEKPGTGSEVAPSKPGKAEFLLLHDTFHVGDAWDGVIAALSKAGHGASAITFPGHGKSAKRGGVTFEDYERALVAALNARAKPVVLVGHSAAGVVMQAAAPRAADKVAALVIHNAFLLGDGQSMIETVPPKIAKAFHAAAAASPDNSMPVNEGFIRNKLMAGESKAATDFVLSQLVPQPSGITPMARSQRSSTSAATEPDTDTPSIRSRWSRLTTLSSPAAIDCANADCWPPWKSPSDSGCPTTRFTDDTGPGCCAHA